MTTPSPQSFSRLLCNLRWLAVISQSVAIWVVVERLHFPLYTPPLWGAVVVLALFNVYATWDARRGKEARAASSFLHLLVDVAVLCWLVSFSGGLENPFSSLFLLPIALAVLALPVRWLWPMAAACFLGYGIAAFLGQELPHMHGATGDTFALHKIGMLVNFAISAAVLLIFFTRMAAVNRARDLEMASLREQFARNEGILALATHAASVAHELNTPLATLTLMVEELEQSGGTPQQLEDYATLRALLNVCRDRVRELAAPAARSVDGAGATRVNLESVIDRWRLVRPTIELRRSGSIAGHEQVEPAVGHLLQVLLNNAADAGEKAGIPVVELRLDMADGRLDGEIRDYGPGLDKAAPLLPAKLFRTEKTGGLGIGLALSHATVERLGGVLSMQAPEQGTGVRVSFCLPEAASA